MNLHIVFKLLSPALLLAMFWGQSNPALAQSGQSNQFCNIQNRYGAWWFLRTTDLQEDLCGAMIRDCRDPSCKVVSRGIFRTDEDNTVQLTCRNYSNSFRGIGLAPLDQAWQKASESRSSCILQIKRTSDIARTPFNPVVTAPQQQSLSNADFTKELLRLLNIERQKVGSQPVAINPKLQQAAKAQAQDMANSGNLTHTGSDGSNLRDRVNRTGLGYGCSPIAENIAQGSTTPRKMIADWLESPGHRRNMLDPQWTSVGLAFSVGKSDDPMIRGTFGVQVFGQCK